MIVLPVDIVILGSCRHEPYRVLAMPNKLDAKMYAEDHEKAYEHACSVFYPAIDKSNLVIVVAPDGKIGEHTQKDIDYAVKQQKQVVIVDNSVNCRNCLLVKVDVPSGGDIDGCLRDDLIDWWEREEKIDLSSLRCDENHVGFVSLRPFDWKPKNHVEFRKWGSQLMTLRDFAYETCKMQIREKVKALREKNGNQ